MTAFGGRITPETPERFTPPTARRSPPGGAPHASADHPPALPRPPPGPAPPRGGAPPMRLRPPALLPAPPLRAPAPRGPAADDDAKAIIAKAIKAHGGEETLAKFQAGQARNKGKIDLPGVGEVEFT